MATFSGRNGRITVGADSTEVIIEGKGNWSVNRSTEEIDTTSFGDGDKTSDVGMRSFSGSMSGNDDPSDTTGQGVVEAAYDTGDLLQDIRFYTKYSTTPGDQIIYFTPDTDADPNAGMRVISLEVSQDKSGVGTITIQLSGSGPVKRVKDTVA